MTRLAFLCLLAILLSSCDSLPVLGTKVEIVQNRNPDGTFRAVSEVRNAAGESPDGSATLYHYPSGDLGVTAWYSGSAGGALNGVAPKLLRK